MKYFDATILCFLIVVAGITTQACVNSAPRAKTPAPSAKSQTKPEPVVANASKAKAAPVPVFVKKRKAMAFLRVETTVNGVVDTSIPNLAFMTSTLGKGENLVQLVNHRNGLFKTREAIELHGQVLDIRFNGAGWWRKNLKIETYKIPSTGDVDLGVIRLDIKDFLAKDCVVFKGKLSHPKLKDMLRLPKFTLELDVEGQFFVAPQYSFYPVWDNEGNFVAVFRLASFDGGVRVSKQVIPRLRLKSDLLDKPLVFEKEEDGIYYFSSATIGAPLVEIDMKVNLPKPLVWVDSAEAANATSVVNPSRGAASVGALLGGRFSPLSYKGQGLFSGVAIGKAGSCDLVVSVKIGSTGVEAAYHHPESLTLKAGEVTKLESKLDTPKASVLSVLYADGSPSNYTFFGVVDAKTKDQLLKATTLKEFNRNDFEYFKDFKTVWSNPVFFPPVSDKGRFLIVASHDYRAMAIELEPGPQVLNLQFKERWASKKAD